MLLISTFLLNILSALGASGQLTPDFYAQTCPNVLSIVTKTVRTLSTASNVVPPSTLRLFVHDCFVQGCDASILIRSTPDNLAERDAPDNKNIAANAFDAIIKAKETVEAVCPGVVSCSDVLALAARDAVVFLGGPTWDVPLGRRDGLISKASLVSGRLPESNFNVAQLVGIFANLGLTQDDLVILSGGHTVGFSHCDQFSNRLYNFNTTATTDPSLDPSFAETLEGKCPQGGGGNTFQPFDLVSPFKFDNQFYINLQKGQGLLFSDQVLFQDPATKAMVDSLAASQDVFFKNFVQAMIKMSTIGVRTGSEGEIRKDCSAFNQPTSPHVPSNSPVNHTPRRPPMSSRVPSFPPHDLNPGPSVSSPINRSPFANAPPSPTFPTTPTVPISNSSPVRNPFPSSSPPQVSNNPSFTTPPTPDSGTPSPPESAPISNSSPVRNPSPSSSPPEVSNDPPFSHATPSAPDSGTPSPPEAVPISNSTPVRNPSPSSSPPEVSNDPPISPETPSTPDSGSPSPPESTPNRRFPGLPFNFPKFPRFRFPRIPGFPGGPGSPSSESRDAPSGASVRFTTTSHDAIKSRNDGGAADTRN